MRSFLGSNTQLDWLETLLEERRFDVVIIDSATKGLTEENAEVKTQASESSTNFPL